MGKWQRANSATSEPPPFRVHGRCSRAVPAGRGGGGGALAAQIGSRSVFVSRPVSAPAESPLSAAPALGCFTRTQAVIQLVVFVRVHCG